MLKQKFSLPLLLSASLALVPLHSMAATLSSAQLAKPIISPPSGLSDPQDKERLGNPTNLERRVYWNILDQTGKTQILRAKPLPTPDRELYFTHEDPKVIYGDLGDRILIGRQTGFAQAIQSDNYFLHFFNAAGLHYAYGANLNDVIKNGTFWEYRETPIDEWIIPKNHVDEKTGAFALYPEKFGYQYSDVASRFKTNSFFIGVITYDDVNKKMEFDITKMPN